MINIVEIIDALKEYSRGDVQFLLYLMSNLKDKMIEKKDRDYISNAIEEICEEKYICPDCFQGLYVRRWKEKRDEFGGYEDMNNLYCANCGWEAGIND